MSMLSVVAPLVRKLLLLSIIAVVSAAVALASLGLVVLRFIIPAPDLPRVAFTDGVLKNAPNQDGVDRVKNEIKAHYHVNADGWMSSHDDYVEVKPPGEYRVAVIGDSYIEGLHIEPDENMAELIEQRLGATKAEVYRLGISGASLAQYLHFLREEVLDYQPDLVVIFMVPNDLQESYRPAQGSYTGSYMKINIDGGEVTGEVAPKPYTDPWYAGITATSATWRYLRHREKNDFQAVKDIILGARDLRLPERETTTVPVAITAPKTDPRNIVAARYLFGKIQEEVEGRGSGCCW
ncbi:MAG: SGNH/GDSL hydrolase family protein [SAR202 cluster bacterium]|nr:SGNH/GDSL hydrolase family protein [SAR202 cluster bacterium]